MNFLVVAILLVFVCLGSSPDVAVYPGAVVDEQVTKANREANAENISYNTTDAFEKVDDYYKKAGSEDVPHSRNTGIITGLVTDASGTFC